MNFYQKEWIGILLTALFAVNGNPISTTGGNVSFNTSDGTICLNSTEPSEIYNPFLQFHFESHRIYFVGILFVILFVCVKYVSEKEFSYCSLLCYRNCDKIFSVNGDLILNCQKHRTTAGNILPESAFLVTSGIVPAVILLKFGINLEGSLDPNLIFNVLLVPIVMDAAWCTDKITFYRNIGTILLFAIIGTVLNAIILAPLFYYGSKSRWGIFDTIDMDAIDAGLYASLICAVDPVAVLSVFESMHIDKLVYNVVFGESLLNDGVAIVFYHSFMDLRNVSNIDFFYSIFIVILYFLYAFIISVILAVGMATVICTISKIFYHHQQMEFVVVFSLNYLTYIIGDFIKGSGIISLFFCVLLQRQYVQANLSTTSNTIISQLLRQLSLMSEGVVFIMMGLTSFAPTGIVKNTDIKFSFFLILACYISRFFVVYLLGTIANIFRKEKLGYKKALFIQAHGGLRGAIGFSLALTLGENFKNRYYYQSATAIMVFFSVYILGASIRPLVNLLKIPIENNEEKSVFSILQEKICDRTKEGIKAIIASSSIRFKWEIWYRKVNNKYLKKWFMHSETLERTVSHSAVLKVFKSQSRLEIQESVHESGSSLNGAKNSSLLKLSKGSNRSQVSFQSLLVRNVDNCDQQITISCENMQPSRFYLNDDK